VPAAAERSASGFANMPADERLLEAHVADVRRRLSPEAFAAAWAAGLALDGAAAVATAMALGDRPGPDPSGADDVAAPGVAAGRDARAV
jgi:hypothetical protein